MSHPVFHSFSSFLRLATAFLFIVLCIHGVSFGQLSEKPIWVGLSYSTPLRSSDIENEFEYKARSLGAYVSIAPFYHSVWEKLSFFVEGQYSFVNLVSKDFFGFFEDETTSDYGIQLGARFDWFSTEDIRIYTALSLGPIWTEEEIEEQGTSLLYSSTGAVGAFLALPDTKFDVGIHLRYRIMDSLEKFEIENSIHNFQIGAGIYFKPNWSSGCHCPRFK